jgi:uncharacterized protein (TIGR01777 family)
MKIVVTGGTGFLGRPLTERLAADGHEVVVLSRHAGGAYKDIRYVTMPSATAEIANADAVVNLAGAGLADSKWTPARKAVLRESRLHTTRAVVDAIAATPDRPRVLVSGSAVGFYGDHADAPQTESSPAGTDFLAVLCADWERAADAAGAHGTRVVKLRTGLALGPGGGLLARMAPPFKFFVGGPLGDGRQWMSWVHVDDWVNAVRAAIRDPRIVGPLNVVAPQPVPNAEFARTLGRVLHRPSLFPVPAFVLRAIFGEMADGAILASQQVVPACLQQTGFRFTYPQLEDALRVSLVS